LGRGRTAAIAESTVFIRKLARSKIEKAARELDITVISAELVEQNKSKEMKK